MIRKCFPCCVERWVIAKSFGRNQINGELIYEQLSSKPDGRNSTRKRQSIIGVANYQYDNRYDLAAVLNYSGTAVLPTGSQFNIYPAVSLGWTVSNEDFLKGNKVVNYLKVKTSVGLSGSDLFGHDLDRQTFGVTGANYWFGSGNTVSTG